MADTDYLTVPHLDRKTLARIFANVTVSISGCWVWTAATIRGYGIVWFNGRNESVHRLIYAWLVQPLPRGLGGGKPVLDHIVCDNPPCCNPAHVRLVLNVENLRRTGSVSAVNRRKTHCKRGHPLPDEPNRWNGYGRTCVICTNTWQREAHRREAAERRASAPPKQLKPVLTAEQILENKRAYHRAYYQKHLDKLRVSGRQNQARHRAKLREHKDSETVHAPDETPRLDPNSK